MVVDDWAATTFDKVATSTPTTPFEPSEFLIDSGSTCHVIGDLIPGYEISGRLTLSLRSEARLSFGVGRLARPTFYSQAGLS